MVRKDKLTQQTLTSPVDRDNDAGETEDGKQRASRPEVGKVAAGNLIPEQSPTNNFAASGGELTHMRGAKIHTVGEISKIIKKYLEGNENFNNVWLRGEISNFTLHRSGHMYFDLKDTESVVPCVMFRNANQYLKFKPEHGMKVIANGSISVYLPHGKYQFILTELLPDGLGALHLAYLQLKEKLSKEGLFALEHKLPIPRYPKILGIVTSPTGAAVRDIIRVATRRYPGIHIILSPCTVQGEGAATEIVQGLKRLHDVQGVDLIIVGRGGGSLEDLWAFNEEVVARAIYDSTIPIISAVGHETDFTIADFVADQRAPTPSTAAELAVPNVEELIQMIQNYARQIKDYLENKVQNSRLHLDRLLESPVFTRPMDRINQQRQYLDMVINNLATNTVHCFDRKRSVFTNNFGKLSALNPKAILQRGYSMTLKLPEQKLVSSVTDITGKDKIKLILKDGAMRCEVEERMNDDDNDE
ncbi:exodeoxyribonuclease VII large subunit [[Eubacterium] cellulosolvens]